MKYTFLFVLLTLMIGCSKKTVPVKEAAPAAVVKPATPPPPKRITKTPPAPFIIINDAAARKDVDGRLYYDLEGKRYWKNYRDGKYYLFNKKMYNDYDFKPRG